MDAVLRKKGWGKIAIIVLAVACGSLTLLYPQWRAFAQAQGYGGDRDGDGLPDEWETNGVDTTGDGEPDLFLNALDEVGEDIPPNPDHKDVYVWVDWLQAEGHEHKPNIEALKRVKNAFSEAPIERLNPDRKRGINLHIVLGQTIDETDEFLEIGEASNGGYTTAEFNGIRTKYLHENGTRPGMSSVFHYVLYAHYLPSFTNKCPTTSNERPGGLAMGGSSDFIINHQSYRDVKGNVDSPYLSALFMHELGHTLGLGHGGIDGSANNRVPNKVNFKPNHLSIMNYSFPEGVPFREDGDSTPVSNRLDYSRFDQGDIADLEEDHGLIEDGGLRVRQALENYGTKWFRDQDDSTGRVRPVNGLNGWIDWNFNGTKEQLGVKANINRDSSRHFFTCFNKYSRLSTSNEWEGLSYTQGDIGELALLVSDYPNEIIVEGPDFPPGLLQKIAKLVEIDIKPGSDPNSINLKSRGVVPVAILTTDTFDATTVDPLSIKFGSSGVIEAHKRGHVEDVDGDGDMDLVLHFKTQETGIQCGDTHASLVGSTFGGQSIDGYDSIRTVGCK
jgi:hypothetical protein